MGDKIKHYRTGYPVQKALLIHVPTTGTAASLWCHFVFAAHPSSQLIWYKWQHIWFTFTGDRKLSPTNFYNKQLCINKNILPEENQIISILCLFTKKNILIRTQDTEEPLVFKDHRRAHKLSWETTEHISQPIFKKYSEYLQKTYLLAW